MDDLSFRLGDRGRYVGKSIVNSQQRLRNFLDALEGVRTGARNLAAPELAQHEGSDSIFFPSPANRRKLSFWIWIDEYNETSIAFGDWHTHSSVASAFNDGDADDSIIETARGILDSRFVIAIDGDGEHAGFSTVVWLDDSDAVAQMFSEPWSPDTIYLRSWDGSIDRTITSNSPPIITT
ncbi:MAG: hypothetical protein ACR2OA_02360 [Rubripirellula sp.]